MTAYNDKSAVLQEWTIAHDHSGFRADLYLALKIGRLTRSKAKRIIQAGDFRKVDSKLKPSQTLRAGETVHLWRLPPREEELDQASVAVIHEDDNWLVINKPPDLAVHPSARYLYNTLTAWLKHYAPGVPAHPCHRLDRETSGVLVCAKNRKAEAHLKVAFQNSLVQKTYLAIAKGHMTEPADVNVPLALQGERGTVRIRMIADVDGLPCRTVLSPLCYDAQSDRTLVRCEPKTGRQHQIRAHLAHIGFPIVGDKLYCMGDDFFDKYTKYELGDRMLELESSRHALHAYSLAFEFQGQQLEYKAALPSDFYSLMSHEVLDELA